MDIHVFFVSDHSAVHVPSHIHSFYQFMYCQSGEGMITIRDKQYHARPGWAYLAGPGVLHGIDPTGHSRLLECKFFAYGNFAAHLQTLPDAFCIADLPDLQALLHENIHEGFMKRELYNEVVDAGFLLFFASVLRKFSKNATQSPCETDYAYLDVAENTKNDMETMVIHLREYIESHLSDQITLDHLVNQVHFNKTYFVKRFKELWGFSPMKYVNALRLQRAERLLMNTDLSLSEIAQQCGFSSLHYFSRKFKEEYASAPLFYRNRLKEP